VKAAEELGDVLAEGGASVGVYHGRLPAAQRARAQNEFMAGHVRIMVATSAFGLGVHKADLRFVLHYHFPGSLEAYYQEAGRAGRDGKGAYCVLLYCAQDRRIQSFFLGGRYPDVDDVRRLIAAVGDTPAPPETLAERAQLSLRKSQVLLSHLKDAGVVASSSDGFVRTSTHLPPADLDALVQAYQLRRAEDRQRLEAVVQYCESTLCRVRILTVYFGEPEPAPCGRCDRCLRERRGAPRRPLVRHPEFGEGEVVMRRGALVTVFFPGVGKRTVREDYLESA
jgi:ATP-dependent DNA helicase RecQ